MVEKNLKQQLRQVIITIILIPLIVMFIYMIMELNANESESTLDELETISSLIEKNVSDEVAYLLYNTNQLSVLFSDIGVLDSLTFDQLVVSFKVNEQIISNMIYVSKEGHYSTSAENKFTEAELENILELVDENLRNKEQLFLFKSRYIISASRILSEGSYSGIILSVSELDTMIDGIRKRFPGKELRVRIYVDDQVFYEDFNEEVSVKISLSNSVNSGVYKVNGNYYMKNFSLKNTDIKYELFFEIDKLNGFISSYRYLFIILGLYLFIAIFAIRFFVNTLMDPIDYLIEELSEIADNEKKDFNLRRQSTKEYDELFLSFNKLSEQVKTSYKNIEKQLTKIEDKNEMMEDLNNQLEESMDQIETSSEILDYTRKKNKALIDNITYMMWRIDKDRRIIYINEEVKNKLGFDTDELIGKSLNSIMCPVHNYESCRDIVSEFFVKDFVEVDLWFLQSDFEQREIYSTSTKRIYENGEIVSVQGISKLVTEDRYLQKEIVSKTQELETLNEISKILTDFEDINTLLELVMDSIHDLTTPLFSSIALLDGDRLTLAALTKEYGKDKLNNTMSSYSDNLKLSIVERKIIIISGQDALKEAIPFIDEPLHNFTDVMYIPMEINNEVIGVLTVVNEKELSELKINVIKLFTQQASVAIDRAKIYSQLKAQYLNTIEALATAVEAKDVYTLGHSLRVAQLSKLLAKEMGCEKEFVQNIEQAGLLHDIGKISISDDILTKSGKLSKFEFEEISRHPEFGEKILRPIGLSNDIMDGVLLHHMRYDLGGYPKNINISKLPLSASIIGVADAFDAITSKRSYHDAQAIELAIKELIRCKGTQFCPEVVNLIEKIFKNERNKIDEIVYSKVGETDVI